MELKAFDLTLREVFLTNLTEVLYLNVLSSSDSVRVYMTVMRCCELKIVWEFEDVKVPQCHG